MPIAKGALNMPQKYTWRFDHYPVSEELPVSVFNDDTWFITNTEIPFFHFHDTLEITYWVEGTGGFIINGTEYDLSAGDLCVICPNALHYSFNRSRQPSRCKYLYVDLDRFLSLNPYGFHDLELLKSHLQGFRPILSSARHPDAVPLLLAIFDEIEKKAQNWHAAVLSLLGLLLNLILRAQEQSEFRNSLSGMDTFPLAPALDLIRARFGEEITARDLAKACHMSDTNFRRVFSKALNMSPMQYLRQVRIQKACEQLILSSDSVAEIAERVGFRSISTFNRDFKQTMRVSPREWRSTHQS